MINSEVLRDEAEQAVISDLLAAGVADKYITLLVADDFADKQYQMIFTAVAVLYSQHQPISVITVGDELARQYGDAGSDAMTALLEARGKYAFTKGMTARENIHVVKEQSKRRHAYSLFSEAAESLQDSSHELDEIFEKVRAGLKALENDNTQQDIMTMQDVLIKAYASLDELATGKNKSIPYGIDGLDSVTAGLHRGEMTIVGARPAVGKSALAMQIAITAAEGGARVLVCSREMTAEQYGMRILMRGANVDSAKLRAGDISTAAWEQLGDSLMRYSQYTNATFAFKTKYVEDLRRLVDRQVNGDGLDVLIVDYTQLMQTRQKFDKDYLRIGYISKELKDISVDYNVAVVALAQVGRAAEGGMPTMAELRGSGDLEQDADNVIFMHRPDSASDKWVHPDDKDKFAGWGMQSLQYIVLNIAKQRQGKTSKTAVLFQPQSMTYESIVREAAGQ